jgi:hypothetical protein
MSYQEREAINGAPDVPALDSKEARTAMTRCLNALDDLTDDQRTRVVRAVAVLYGIRLG